MPARIQEHIICIIGTRPELIKMAPVVHALSTMSRFRVTVLCSGQHRDLLGPLANWFGISFHHDLNVMTEAQSLSGLTSRLMLALEHYLEQERPELVIAQGDTTTVMCAALSCYYLGIPFAHVEAGLRTGDIDNPFPEESNRIIADRLARYHFCPTEASARNLHREGIVAGNISVTGNTVIDALRYTLAKLAPGTVPRARHDVLLTAHRRENFGRPLDNVFRAVQVLVEEREGLTVLYPAHPNPRVSARAHAMLRGHPRITFTGPLAYPELVQAMLDARFILTDSGGIQEEAPALGKPVLVLRSVTERPEAVDLGVAQLVGTDTEVVVQACRRLLDDPAHYARMARQVSPYGDGRAAERIRDVLCVSLQSRR